MDGTKAEEDACIRAPQQKPLSDDAEKKRAARAQKKRARAQKKTALNGEMAARKQETAVMAADHEAQRAAEAAGAKQPRADVESREALREAAQQARDEYGLQIIHFLDDMVASRMVEFEAAEVSGIQFLPRPIDEWMPSPPILALSPSVTATSHAPAELHCDPRRLRQQDISPIVVLREEFLSLPLENLKFIRMMREEIARVAPDDYTPRHPPLTNGLPTLCC